LGNHQAMYSIVLFPSSCKDRSLHEAILTVFEDWVRSVASYVLIAATNVCVRRLMHFVRAILRRHGSECARLICNASPDN